MNALADLLLVLAIAAVFMGGLVAGEVARMAWQHRPSLTDRKGSHRHG